MAATIYIFRHGQTTYNRDGIFTGHVDAKLTKKGQEDAKILAERLKHKKIHVAFCTSLSRSRDTLKEILKYHPECKLILTDDRMIERDYGKLATQTHWEVVKHYGTEHYDSWHRDFKKRPPKGESFADVEKRVQHFLKDLKKLAIKEELNIAISAHGNSIRLFRKIMEKLNVHQTTQLEIPYDNFYEYQLSSR